MSTFSPSTANRTTRERMLRFSSSRDITLRRPFNLDPNSGRAYTKELLALVPPAVHEFLPFTEGISYAYRFTDDLLRQDPTNRFPDFDFELTLIGQSEGTKKFNADKRTDLVDKVEIHGRFLNSDLRRMIMDGDYLIYIPLTVYNIHFVEGSRFGSVERPIANSRGNAILVEDDNNRTIKDTYTNTQQVTKVIDDFLLREKTTFEMKKGQYFAIIRSNLDTRLMISLTETFDINEKVSQPPAPSISDNRENRMVREVLGLQPEPHISRLTAKDHPLIGQIMREKAKRYTLLTTYTAEGIIYDCYLTEYISNDDMANGAVLNRRLAVLEKERRRPSHILIQEGKVSSLLLEQVVKEQGQRFIFGSFDTLATDQYGL